MPGTVPTWVTAAGQRLDPFLKRRLAELYDRPPWLTAAVTGPLRALWRERFHRIPVLIKLKQDGTGRSSEDEICSFLESAGCRSLVRLQLINAIATRVSLGTLRRLVDHPHVERLALDRTVHTLMDKAAVAVGAPPVWRAGDRGAGTGIAVLDTGIYPHTDFIQPKRRLIAFKDIVSGRTQPYDDNGHGTHVAGIAAGNGIRSAGRYSGIAPGAHLIGVKVLDGRGSGTLSHVIKGLEWICQNARKYDIRVLNCSIGGPAFESYRHDPLAQAIEQVLQCNITVCAAAGNSGPGAGTITTPGIHPQVITVGACTRWPLEVADFSSRGPTPDGLVKPDVVAPGVNIMSCNAPGSAIARRDRVDAPYIAMTGTSMASPIVAGITALILNRHPRLSPAHVKELILATAKDFGAAPLAAGRGLAQARPAIEWPSGSQAIFSKIAARP